ncbi:hypothetical protein [Caldalkalibacillus salinus]|uniref:hypothetical protein n=1 Tax=Caldalkalibacillus salinus TaxID=2803787 RepID=UPI0019234219|nr:hypothetical protein [Caldalkalibacillus salinus]
MIEIKKNILENKVLEHLINQGYVENEIIEITGQFGKLPNFGVHVRFEDEPLIGYFYLERDGKIKQLSWYVTREGREKGVRKEQIQPKHHVPMRYLY